MNVHSPDEGTYLGFIIIVDYFSFGLERIRVLRASLISIVEVGGGSVRQNGDRDSGTPSLTTLDLMATGNTKH